MKKWLIFGGTTEGREVAEKMSLAAVDCDICVATAYGEQVLSQMPHVTVLCGRLDKEGMKQLFLKESYQGVIDATHPFAVQVTETILEALHEISNEQKGNENGVRLPYFRLGRKIDLATEDSSFICAYENMDACVQALLNTEGNIFLTTGTKDLPVFCGQESLKKRLIVRVLPGIENLEICYRCGLEGKQIIAMQGPFSQEINEALIRQYQVKHLVTKESGRTGGLEEKLEACRQTDIQCHLIQKPKTDSGIKEYSMEELLGIVLPSVQSSGEEKHAGHQNVQPVFYVTLAGIGMGEKSTYTKEVLDCIEEADYLFGAARMIEAHQGKKGTYPYYKKEDILGVFEELKNTEKQEVNVTILLSGDSGFFSGCEQLTIAFKQIEGLQYRILPGISSVSYLAAKCGISWQDANIISLHGTKTSKWQSDLLASVRHHKKTFFLTSGAADVRKMGAFLAEYFSKEKLQVVLGYGLSYPDEIVQTLSIDECETVEKEGLYCGFILQEEVKTRIVPGLKDDLFERDKVPMTKEEIRALSICKLGITDKSVIYDIGSGTGSIAMELALLSPDVQVYAIETNETAISLLERNRKKLGAFNVEIVSALAPDGLEDLPTPTHAFLGGTKGKLKEILECLYAKNPNMKVVMNAVSMESICAMQSLSDAFPMKDFEAAQIAVSKTKEVGAYHMMQAQNPVTIFSFQFCEKEE